CSHLCTFASHSASSCTDQNQHDRPGISKHATLGMVLPPLLTVYSATGHFSMDTKQEMSGKCKYGSAGPPGEQSPGGTRPGTPKLKTFGQPCRRRPFGRPRPAPELGFAQPLGCDPGRTWENESNPSARGFSWGFLTPEMDGPLD